MSDPQSSLTESVSQATQAGAAGQHDATDAAAQALYGHLFGALGGEGVDPAVRTAEACAGLVLANKKGKFALLHLARGGAVGVTHAAIGRQLDPALLLDAAMQRMLSDAAAMGADCGAVAMGLLQGSLVAAAELGLSTRELGSAVAVAALEHSAQLEEADRAKIQRLVNRRVMGQEFEIPCSLLTS